MLRALLLPLALTTILAAASASGCKVSAGDELNVPSGQSPLDGTSRLIDVDALHAQLSDVALLVDVRSPSEFEGGHIPGARNIPMDKLEARLSELDEHRGTEIFLVCHSGGRSARAASWLSDRGYQVVDVAGGTARWIQRGHPTE